MPSSPDPSLGFPTREECVLPEMLAARALATPDKPFALFDDETWTLRSCSDGGVARGPCPATRGRRDGGLRLGVDADRP